MKQTNISKASGDIVFRGVTKRFGDETVLSDLSVTVSGRGITVLMGESGRGKTTLCALISGLFSPDEGRIENPFTRISYAFQDPRLLPWQTAIENVMFVLNGMTKSEKISVAREALSALGLEDALYKYPHELSGGMQQRVSLARAFSAPHDFLILDEPFRGLDEKNKETVIAYLLKTESPILLVTHDMTDAERLGATVLSL